MKKTLELNLKDEKGNQRVAYVKIAIGEEGSRYIDIIDKEKEATNFHGIQKRDLKRIINSVYGVVDTVWEITDDGEEIKRTLHIKQKRIHAGLS